MEKVERIATGREPRIVVVDDEPSLLACIAMILRQENYQVFEAHNAKDALALLRLHGADLLLTDVKMPGTSGLTLVRWLRAEPTLRYIPVILFTSAHEEAQARTLGVVDYIFKPAPRQELLERVFRGICLGAMQQK